MNKHVLLAAFLCTYIVVAAQDPQANQAEDLFQMQTENGSLALDKDTTGHILAFLSRQDMRTLRKTCKKNNRAIKAIKLSNFEKKHQKVVEHLKENDFHGCVDPSFSHLYKSMLSSEISLYPELFLLFFEKYPTFVFIRDNSKYDCIKSVSKIDFDKQGRTFIERFLNIAEKNHQKLIQADTSGIIKSCMDPFFSFRNIFLLDRLGASILNFVKRYEKNQRLIEPYFSDLSYKFGYNLYMLLFLKKEQLLGNNTISLEQVESGDLLWLRDLDNYCYYEEIPNLKFLNSKIKPLVQNAYMFLKNIRITRTSPDDVKGAREEIIEALEKNRRLQEIEQRPKRQDLLKKMTISATCLAGLWVVTRNILRAS